MERFDKAEFWTLCGANNLPLDEKHLARFERLHSEVTTWNKQVNLISRKDTDNIYERHILHSLAIAKYVDFPKNARCLDVGTGGGFPGIPLKIYYPQLKMLLIDSIAKKIKIARMLAQHTQIPNIEARTGRAEALADEPKFRREFDCVFSRAVAPLVQLISWTDMLVKRTGKVIALKGGDLTEEINQAQEKFPDLEVKVHDISMVGLPWFEKNEKKVVECTFI